MTAAPGKGAPLLANLSVSDLRGLTPETFGLLALPVGEYLSVRSGKGVTPTEALQGEFPDVSPLDSLSLLPCALLGVGFESVESERAFCAIREMFTGGWGL